jgi:predicted MFS family arabinose efflux permease
VDEFAGFLPAGAFESYRTDLGLSYSEASIVLTAAAPGAIAGTVFSVLADYRSRRVIATGGAIAFAVALLGFGVAGSFALLVGASFLHGCAATALVDASELALVDLAGEDAPAAVSRSHLVGAVGDFCGPLLLIVASATGIGWRGAFIAAAVVVAAYAVRVAFLPLPGPRRDGEHERMREGLLEVIRDRRVWFCGVVAMLMGPLDEPFLAFLLASLERTRDLSTVAATTIALAWTIGSFVALAITSRPGFRTPPRDFVWFCAVVALAAAGCVLAPSPLLVAVCALVFGYAFCRFFVALMTRILDIRPGQLGTVYAVISAVEFSGFLLPLGAGRIADAFGIGAGLACYVLIALLLLGLVWTQARRERAI